MSSYLDSQIEKQTVRVDCGCHTDKPEVVCVPKRPVHIPTSEHSILDAAKKKQCGCCGGDGTATLSVAGKDGKSAYEIAVDNGFQGTEQEWLASLHGADGHDGADANSYKVVTFDSYQDFLEYEHFAENYYGEWKEGKKVRIRIDGLLPINTRLIIEDLKEMPMLAFCHNFNFRYNDSQHQDARLKLNMVQRGIPAVFYNADIWCRFGVLRDFERYNVVYRIAPIPYKASYEDNLFEIDYRGEILTLWNKYASAAFETSDDGNINRYATPIWYGVIVQNNEDLLVATDGLFEVEPQMLTDIAWGRSDGIFIASRNDVTLSGVEKYNPISGINMLTRDYSSRDVHLWVTDVIQRLRVKLNPEHDELENKTII